MHVLSDSCSDRQEPTISNSIAHTLAASGVNSSHETRKPENYGNNFPPIVENNDSVDSEGPNQGIYLVQWDGHQFQLALLTQPHLSQLPRLPTQPVLMHRTGTSPYYLVMSHWCIGTPMDGLKTMVLLDMVFY